MTDFSVRPVEKTDAAFIAQILTLSHVRSVLDGPTAEQVARLIEKRSFEQFLILGEGRPVGLVAIAQHDTWLFEILRLIAAHEHRGIGRFGTSWATRHIFEERHAHRAYLEVHASNTRAVALYQACGFIYEGTYRDGARTPTNGRFEDLHIYGMLEDEYRTALTRQA